ncbi:hypothetical protein [Hymenobacter actinosclerus]|nr:hypothetical protein [Hymenobacter actinosclerus]
MSLDKTATVIQHLVDERNKPGFDLLCKVFEVYPNVSKDWLLEGREPMLTDEAEAATATPEAPAEPVPQPTAPALTAAPEPRTEKPAATAAPASTAASTEAPPLAAPVAAPAPVAPAPVEAPVVPVAAPQPAPVSTAAAPVPTAAPDASWQTALYTQQMAHQLAMAELRNQHLQDQQRMMQQMMDLMQRQLA